MLCGVTATLGSNPSATATAARPHWGRAVLLCLDGVGGLLPRQISGRRAACPPASAVRTASFARRVVSKPGQAPQAPRRPPIGRGLRRVCLLWPCRRPPALRRGPAACSASYPGYHALITEPTANFACNSPTILSDFEIRLLELRRFQTLLKLHSIELHASFLRGGRIDACWCCSGIPQARCAVV